ncbi:MAG TPA: FAD-dependent oxidoreductase [Chryseosolibacter sp.]|nr:FAD-dependent oxidoreductase [Chryseosolibacter sp.]
MAEDQPTQKIVDYLIIGQGLAGSLVAYQALKRNKRIHVIDLPENNHCTKVAPGLFNPVTGQNLVKSWLTDLVFPYLHDFYPELEQVTGKRFFYSLPLYRPFSNISEQNDWMAKSADPVYSEILEKIYGNTVFPELNDPHGGLLLKYCGFIDTSVMLEAVRKVLIDHGAFTSENFDHQRLDVDSTGVSYSGIRALKIVFCEGAHVSHNPWFSRLPIRPLKGEILEIKTAFSKQVIVNRGVYMVPSPHGMNWRVGSTYVLKNPTPVTTENGRHEIEMKLQSIYTQRFEVTGHEWGIRPTTVDRRPIIGAHPKSERIVIFNGLGTKGVSLAPYFSEMLIHWLDGKTTLNSEVDVTRYKSLY